ncbi:hypothetical protein OC842_006142, partial [Tilletia horrida]
LRRRQDSALRRVLPTTDSVLRFPGLPGASSGIGGVTSVVPTSGVLPASGLPGVSSGIGSVTSIISGATDILPTSGVLPASGLPGVSSGIGGVTSRRTSCLPTACSRLLACLA